MFHGSPDLTIKGKCHDECHDDTVVVVHKDDKEDTTDTMGDDTATEK